LSTVAAALNGPAVFGAWAEPGMVDSVPATSAGAIKTMAAIRCGRGLATQVFFLWYKDSPLAAARWGEPIDRQECLA